MEKAHDFEFYFADDRQEKNVREKLQEVRKIAHEIDPKVREKVAYAMPGFYPASATKANQQYFLLAATKNGIGFYGVILPEEIRENFAKKYGAEFGKGSIKLPYEMDENNLREIIETVMKINVWRKK